jgi:hypothetical protein
MFTSYFSEKNLMLLSAVATLGAFFIGLYFFNTIIKNESYLIYSANGTVQRAIVSNYKFNSLLIAAVISIAGSLILFLLLIFIRTTMLNQQLPLDIESKDLSKDLTDENEVFYGQGKISDLTMKKFVRQHPEAAVKFIFKKNIDGSDLDPLIRRLHSDWLLRGMNQEVIQSEILSILGEESMPERNLYELTIDLRNKILELGMVEPAN